MSKYHSPKITPKDVQGYHLSSSKRGATHQARSPLRVGVPNADRVGQIGNHVPTLNLLNPKDVNFRQLGDRYAALERHAIEVTEENARLHQMLLESNIKERAKFESLISLTNPSFTSQHIQQLKSHDSLENTAGANQNITGSISISDAQHAIIGIYTQSQSLAPMLTYRQNLANDLAEDTLRRKTQLGIELESVKKKDQKKRERLARKALKHQLSLDSSSKPRPISSITNSHLDTAKTSAHSASPYECNEVPTPFHALGLSIPEARFRLSLRSGSDVRVWAEGEWVHGTVSSIRSGNIKTQLLENFEAMTESEPPLLALNEMGACSSSSSPHSTPLKPSLPMTVNGKYDTLEAHSGIVFTESQVTNSPIVESQIVPLQLPTQSDSKGLNQTPTLTHSVPHTPATSSIHSNSLTSWTPLLNSAVLSGQNYQSHDNLRDAARWLCSSYIDIRVGRIMARHALLSSSIADPNAPSPLAEPSDISQKMQARMKKVQLQLNQEYSTSLLDGVTNHLDQLVITPRIEEFERVEEDSLTESDANDDWSDIEEDNINPSGTEYFAVHNVDTLSKEVGSLSGDEILARQKSPLIRVTTGEGDFEALKAELSVMRLVANKLSSAFSPIDSSVLANIEPALRNVCHTKKICERVANSLKMIVDSSSHDLKEVDKELKKAGGHLSTASYRETGLRRKSLLKYAKQVELLRGELLVLEPPLLSICENLHQVALEVPGNTMSYLSQHAEPPKGRDKHESDDLGEATLSFGSWVPVVSGIHALSNVLFSTQVEILELVKNLRSLIDETDGLLTSLGKPPKIRLIPETNISDQSWIGQMNVDSVDPVFSVIFSENKRMAEAEYSFTASTPAKSKLTSLSGTTSYSPDIHAKPMPFVASLVPPSLLRGPSILFEDAHDAHNDGQSVEEAQRIKEEEQAAKSAQLELLKQRRRQDEIRKQEEDLSKRYGNLRRRNDRDGSDSDTSESSSRPSHSGQRFEDGSFSTDSESEAEMGGARSPYRSGDSIRQNNEASSRNRDPAVARKEERRQRRQIREQQKAERLERRMRENQFQLEKVGYTSVSFLHSQNVLSQGFDWNVRPFYAQQNQRQPVGKWTFGQSQTLHNSPQLQPHRLTNQVQISQISASYSQSHRNFKSESTSKYQHRQFPDTRPYSAQRFQPLTLPSNTTTAQMLKARTQIELQTVDCASKLVHLSPSNCTIEKYQAQLTNFENLLWVYEQLTSSLQQIGALSRNAVSPDLIALLRYESLQPAIKNVVDAIEGRYHPARSSQTESTQIGHQSYQPRTSVTTTRLPAPNMPSRSIESTATRSPILSHASVSDKVPSAPLLSAPALSTPDLPPLSLSLSTPVVSDDDDGEPPGGLAPPSLTRAGPNLT